MRERQHREAEEHQKLQRLEEERLKERQREELRKMKEQVGFLARFRIAAAITLLRWCLEKAESIDA